MIGRLQFHKVGIIISVVSGTCGRLRIETLQLYSITLTAIMYTCSDYQLNGQCIRSSFVEMLHHI